MHIKRRIYERLNHTKKNKLISIIPNDITIYTNNIHVGHHRKQYSNKSVTHNDITTIDSKNNKAISKQNTIQYSESQSSVGTSIDSDASFHNLRQKRNNNKRLPTNWEDIELNINFDDNIHSNSYISLPTKIGTVRKNINNNTYNNNSNSSESDFSLARLNKRMRYSSNTKLDRTGTNIRVHNKNINNNKLGKKKKKIQIII